jgi:hypothetical protein
MDEIKSFLLEHYPPAKGWPDSNDQLELQQLADIIETSLGKSVELSKLRELLVKMGYTSDTMEHSTLWLVL